MNCLDMMKPNDENNGERMADSILIIEDDEHISRVLRLELEHEDTGSVPHLMARKE